MVKTKAASRELMCPVFNTELWIPVTFPAMTAKIRHGVWDQDFGPDPDDMVTTTLLLVDTVLFLNLTPRCFLVGGGAGDSCQHETFSFVFFFFPINQTTN